MGNLLYTFSPKILHIFEETDKCIYFIYRELAGIIFT